MTTPEFDATRYKSTQRQEWDAVAAGWNKWWEIIEKGAQHVSDRLVELAAIKPGHHVLDVATGIGEPCLTAARRVGATGKVIGTDQSPQMLALARKRATDLGLTNVEFREMDAEALDLPEESFDAVLCRWGLMFLPDLTEVLSSIHRLLVSSGRFAATVWGEPQAVPMLSLPMGVVRHPWRRLAAEIIRSGLYREGVSYVSGRCGQFWASMLGLDADYLFDMAGGVGPLEASAGCGCDKPHFFSDSMTRETDLEPWEGPTKGENNAYPSQH